MSFLPGLYQYKEYWSPVEYWVFVCENWLLILISVFVMMLAFVNFWQIIIRQRRWQSPLLL